MLAFRILTGSALALGLLAAGCGDDGEVTTGLSAGSAASMSGSSGGSSGGGSSGDSGTPESTGSASGSESTGGSPTTTAGGSSTTLPPPTTTGGPDETTGGGTTDTGGGAACGNGKIDANEQCDGGNLNGFTCESLGNAGGSLGCDPVTCTFDTSMCDGGGSDGTSG